MRPIKKLINQLANTYLNHPFEIQQKVRLLLLLLSSFFIISIFFLSLLIWPINGSHECFPFLLLSWVLLFGISIIVLLKGFYRFTINFLATGLFFNLLFWFSLTSGSLSFLWKLSLLLQIPIVLLVFFGYHLRQLVLFCLCSMGILLGCYSNSIPNAGTNLTGDPSFIFGFHFVFNLFLILMYNTHLQIHLKLRSRYLDSHEGSSKLVVTNQKLSKALNVGDASVWELFPKEDILKVYERAHLFDDLSKDGFEYDLKALRLLLAPEDNQRIHQVLQKLLEEKAEKATFEHQILINDETRWLSHKATVLNPVSGQQKTLLGITQDITDWKATEVDLQTSREKYRLLFNNDLVGLYQISLDQNRILECNLHTAKLFGYHSIGAFLKAAKLENLMVDPTTIEFVTKALERKREISNFETQFIKCDQSRFWGRYSLKPSAQGRYVEGVITDITLQKKTETQLNQSEKRFQDLVENALMGISIVKGTRFVYMNPEQERIFFPRQHLTKLEDLEVYSDDKKKYQQICKTIGEMQPIQNDIEIRFYPSEEHKHRKELRHVVLRTDQIIYQDQSMTLINMTDITHIKKMEHLALLRSKMSSLGHISVGIAHEIRSPLTGINLLVDGLRSSFAQQEAEDDTFEALDQIQKATQKVETVVKRVMDFSKPSEPQVKAGSINTPIQGAASLSKTLLDKAKVTLNLSLSEKIPNLFLDTHLMEQVFLNLIGNAVTAMQYQEKAKMVHISSLQQGNDILVVVSDSGPGISEHLHTKIFDPFFTTKNEGTGIGLSICQRIIADHGGVIHISTSDIKGAQFNISLPIDKRQIKR